MTAPAPNPLIATPDNSTPWYAGITIIEGIVEVKNGIESGSWVSTTIGSLGVAIDATLFVLNPIAATTSWVVAAIIEHVEFLSEALDWLAGDPEQAAANAQTWRNIAAHLRQAAEEYDAAVKREVALWIGEAADAYRTSAETERLALVGYAEAADAKASAVELSGAVVLTVRTLVRDLIADFVATAVARAPMWTAGEVLTLGGATPWVTAEVSSLAARWALKISRLLEDLVSSLDQLAALVRRVDEYTIELDGRPRAGGVDAGRGPDGHGLPSGGRPWDDLPGSAPGEGIPGFVPPPPHSGRPDLPTKALDPYFEGETDPKRAAEIFGSEVKGVRYLTPVQAERYRVFVQDGKLYHINGVPVDTRAAESLHGGGGRAIFVMDSQGNLYLSTFHERGYFHHSSLLGGRPVAGAGEMVVENGRIVEMTDKSGHYQPPPEFRQQVLDVLAAEGVDVSTIEVRSW